MVGLKRLLNDLAAAAARLLGRQPAPVEFPRGLPRASEREGLEAYAARMSAHESPDAPAGQLAWSRCPCCDAAFPGAYCAVCEWEPDLSGGLAEAPARRERFREAGTVYSADELAQWQGTMPGPEERNLQAEAVALCGRGRGGELPYAEWWSVFRGTVHALQVARHARQEQDAARDS